MEKEVAFLLSSIVYITSVIVQLSLYSTVSVYTKYGAHAVSEYDFAATFSILLSLFGPFQIGVDFFVNLLKHPL